jgi:hypothetical protein
MWVNRRTAGLALASCHALVFLVVAGFVVHSSSDAQWQLGWVVFRKIDFPVSLMTIPLFLWCPRVSLPLVPYPYSELKGFILPTLIYGVLGTFWYYMLPFMLFFFVRKLRRIAEVIKIKFFDAKY